MTRLFSGYTAVCHALIGALLRGALAIDRHERWAVRTAKRLRGSVLRLLRKWFGIRPPHRAVRGRVPWNRTPPEVEQSVIRLHLQHRDLGAGRLRSLLRRTLGVRPSRQTIFNILGRKPRDDSDATKGSAQARTIDVSRPRELWGIDLTLVWVLGFFPVWLLGVVDYHGSRLLALERLTAPTATEVCRILDRVIGVQGRPERILSDNGSVFRAAELAAMLATYGVTQTFTRPRHPWTNGRIERVFRTFKETVFTHIWLFASRAEIDRYGRDFVLFYNRDRPHSRFDDRTPDEVYFGRDPVKAPLGRVSYFDGHLDWYRFG